jgi:hypothetical protein
MLIDEIKKALKEEMAENISYYTSCINAEIEEAAEVIKGCETGACFERYIWKSCEEQYGDARDKIHSLGALGYCQRDCKGNYRRQVQG